MVERIIELSVRHKWLVFGAVIVGALWAADSVRKTPLDALPDLSDPQVIVYTEWMGRSPDLVEDQITYPLVRALRSTPGVATVRGYSMFGMSFAYALFGEGTDIYWARTRVLEQLGAGWGFGFSNRLFLFYCGGVFFGAWWGGGFHYPAAPPSLAAGGWV
jgi:Cu(I)/Ag(I) efflux system membrane protein CusA/SilA